MVQQLIDEAKTFADLSRVQALLAAEGVEVAEEQLSDILDPERCVWRMTSLGGTAPEQVRTMIERLRTGVASSRERVRARQQQCAQARERTADIIEGVLSGAKLGDVL